MKGFCETWAHIFVGLVIATCFAGVVFAIYDIGRVHGRRGEVPSYKAGWERGYEAGREYEIFRRGGK